MAGNRLLGILAFNGDYFVVGNRRNDQYAIYYQAFRLPEFVMGAQLNALSAVLFPSYSRIRSEGPEALRQAMYRALRLVALFSIPVGVGLALIARDSFTLFYGTESDIGIRTMEVISLAGAVTGIGFATGDLLMAINRPGVLLRLNMAMVPTMLVAMWFVAPQGIVWVAVVHLVIQVVFIALAPDHRRPHHRGQRPDVGRLPAAGSGGRGRDHRMCAPGPPRHRHRLRVARRRLRRRGRGWPAGGGRLPAGAGAGHGAGAEGAGLTRSLIRSRAGRARRQAAAPATTERPAGPTPKRTRTSSRRSRAQSAL